MCLMYVFNIIDKQFFCKGYRVFIQVVTGINEELCLVSNQQKLNLHGMRSCRQNHGIAAENVNFKPG